MSSPITISDSIYKEIASKLREKIDYETSYISDVISDGTWKLSLSAVIYPKDIVPVWWEFSIDGNLNTDFSFEKLKRFYKVLPYLAIKGHKTRCDDIVSILKSLSSQPDYYISIDCDETGLLYLDDHGVIGIDSIQNANDYEFCYTLEEFESRYPFKLNQVVLMDSGRFKISQIVWKNGKILYQCDDISNPKNWLWASVDKISELPIKEDLEELDNFIKSRERTLVNFSGTGFIPKVTPKEDGWYDTIRCGLSGIYIMVNEYKDGKWMIQVLDGSTTIAYSRDKIDHLIKKYL